MTPQCQQIVNHIEKWGSINSIEAIQRYGITRLAARIHELKGTQYAMKAVKADNTAKGFVTYVPDTTARAKIQAAHLTATICDPALPNNVKAVACLRAAQTFTQLAA